MNPNTTAQANTAYQQSQDLQNQYNQQQTQAQGQYNTSVSNAQNAQNQLQDFTKNIQSGTDMYNKNIASQNDMYKFNPQGLGQAQNYLSQQVGINAALPQTIQAQSGGYGNASQVGGALAGMQSIYGQGIARSNQDVQNQMQLGQLAQTGAQNATTAGVTTQEQQRQGYASSAQNATQIMQQSQVAMNQIEQIAQNQGTLTANQQQAYALAKASYAQAAQAQAQIGLIGMQTTGANLSNQMIQDNMNSQAYKNQLATGDPNIPEGTPIGPTTQQIEQNHVNKAPFAPNGIVDVSGAIGNWWNNDVLGAIGNWWNKPPLM